MSPNTKNNAQNVDVEPSRGIEFDDTRYSGHKYLVSDDDRGYKEGDEVFIGTSTRTYGPYRLGKQIAEGNGKVRWLAFANGQSTMRNKPLTKAELEEQNAAKDEEIRKLREQVAAAK